MPPENVHLCRTVPGAIDALTASKSKLASGDICLVKASRAARMERVAEALKEHFGEEKPSREGVNERMQRSSRSQQRPGART